MRGFSLVEMMIAFAIIVIIFAAIVPQFRAIRNSWTCNEAKAEIIQNGRILAEHITRNLAAAKQIISVTPSSDLNGSITFRDSNNVWRCYMFSDGYVVFGAVDSEEQLAGPVDRFQIRCYSLSDLNTPTTDANVIRLVQVETDFPNDDTMGTDKTFKSEVFIQANTQSASEQSVIDIMVKLAQPNTAFDSNSPGDDGCNDVIDIDTDPLTHGLLCFKNIVGTEANQVPLGQPITLANLRLWYINNNNNNNVYFYRMTIPWTKTSTWNSIGGGLIAGTNYDNSDGNAIATFSTNDPIDVNINVTSIVRSWINGNYENYGFGIINSVSNNVQFVASENTTGTGAYHPPILEVAYQPFDVNIIGSWVEGTTHAKESGTNRALIFIAHSEDNDNPSILLDSVSYGGQPMTKIIENTYGNTSTSRAYVVAFILNEAGVAAASGSTFTVSWNQIPDSAGYSSVFLRNVNQTNPIRASAGNGVANTGDISTSALVNNAGDMVIDAATSSSEGLYTHNGFTEALEVTITSADGTAGYKFTTTDANETPSVTHSVSSTVRHVLIGFVVNAWRQQWTFSNGTIESEQVMP